MPLWVLLLTAVIGLGVGAAIGESDNGDTDETAVATGDNTERPAASVNNKTPLTSEQATTTTKAQPTTTTTELVTTTTLPPYDPQPADFEIAIVETERSCFGSAGCNITYRIEAAYVGERPMRQPARYTVVYEVRGGDDLQTKNFEVRGDQYEFSTEMIGTPPDPNLTAVAVRVLKD